MMATPKLLKGKAGFLTLTTIFLACVSFLYSNDQIRRQLITKADPLRVAVFGSSHSWGASLTERYDAYPFRISPTVDNFAYFSQGPNYPAVCTQTVIGDIAIYDLILLEYYVSGSDTGLAELARRLRARFPAAIIIVMKFYGPFDAIRGSTLSDEKGQSLIQWKGTLTLKDKDLNTFINAIDADTGYWRFREHPKADRAINHVVREIDGYQFHLPKASTPKETLVSYLRFFDKDNHMHLSERGHAYVADMCRKIIKMHIIRGKHNPLAHVNKAAPVGTWGRGDACNLWHTTGGCTHKFSPSAKVLEYDEKRGKFALEVPSAGGWIDVENTFADARTLFVSFMATATDGVYPKLDLKHGNNTYTLDTFAGKGDKFGVGIVRTVPVGMIKGGVVTRLHLTPKSKKQFLFRLVGTTITSEAMVPAEYGFGPIFNV